YLDLDLLTDGQHVLDVLDALAAHALAGLADVQPPLLAPGARGVRARRRPLGDRADQAPAELRALRVGRRVDRRAGGLGRQAVGGADVDGAVALDGDVRARLLLDLVDHLALGPDDLADLVDRHLHGDDARSVRGHLVGHVDGLGEDVEDRQARVTRLGQRTGE